MADGVAVTPGTGSTIATDDIAGQHYQRNKLVIGADGVNDGDVSATNPVPATLKAASSPTLVIGTVQAPTITKGAQATEGFTTQDMKDAGRFIVNASTVIAGVAGVAAEALLALDISRGGAATASATSHPVTANKRWRVTGILVGIINTGAAVISVRASLRFNPTGAAIVTSPIIATISLSSAPAIAQQGNEMFIPLPDGTEFSGSNQIALSHVGNAAGYTIWASVLGFEY